MIWYFHAWNIHWKTREERKFEENPSLKTKWSGITQIKNEKKNFFGQIACSKEQMEAP